MQKDYFLLAKCAEWIIDNIILILLFGLITGSPFRFRVGPPEVGDTDNLDTEPAEAEEGTDVDDIGNTCSFNTCLSIQWLNWYDFLNEETVNLLISYSNWFYSNYDL